MELHWPNKLDEASFLKQYWQTRPLLIRNAFQIKDSPLSPDELAGLALEEDVESRIILRESDTKWHCRYGPFAAAELEDLPAEDWTLLVTDVEKHLPELRDWLKPFHFIPGWRIDDLMISYAPPGASVGAHTDNYDVFLLQVAGKRKWSICDDLTADRSQIPDLEIGILENFNATETWELEPGDMLYLPPGVPHHGVSMDKDCMTWSIGFRAPSHQEIVTSIAEHLASQIPEEAFYSDPAILLHENHGQISPNAIARIRDIWNSYVHPDAQTFDSLAGCLLTGGNKQLNRNTESETINLAAENPSDSNGTTDTDAKVATSIKSAQQLLSSSSFLERNSFSRFAFIANVDVDAANTSKREAVLNKIREKVIRKSESDLEVANETGMGTQTLDHSSDQEETYQGADSTNHGDSQPDTAMLFVDGEEFTCSTGLAQVLTNGYVYSAQELSGFMESSQEIDGLTDSTTIAKLFELGHLQVVDADN